MPIPGALPILDTDNPPFGNAYKIWDDAHGCVMWKARPGTRDYAEGAWAFYDPADEVRYLRRSADRQREYAAEARQKADTDIWYARNELRAGRGGSTAFGWTCWNNAVQFYRFAREGRKAAKRHLEQMRLSLQHAAEIEARLRPMAAE